MDREPDRTLDYFRGRTSRQMMLPSADIFLSTVVFAISHLVAEYYTASFLDLRLGVIGPTATAREWEIVHDRFISGMVIEAVWIIMAAVVVLMIQWLFQPQISNGRSSRVWIAAIFAGVFYCWLRWGIWFISEILRVSYPEFADYLLSMAIAALIGIGLAMLRRKLSQPTHTPVLPVVIKGS